MHDTKDIYSRITDKIVADLEQGVRPWMKPWNAEHAAGKITRPLRCNGIAYKGIHVMMLWAASVDKGYSCPIWLTFKQALELGRALHPLLADEQGGMSRHRNKADAHVLAAAFVFPYRECSRSNAALANFRVSASGQDHSVSRMANASESGRRGSSGVSFAQISAPRSTNAFKS